ncbi:MAG: hypothetical protein O3B24_06710, partial [Verrucomicrobia bacterium]|nr:hypothetical protein [Verrucomicrobiota bacterium]
AAVALALPMAFGGLLLNGLVEYNFGDAEIVLAYGMLIGGIAAGGRLQVEIGATVQTLPKEQR